MNTPEVSTWALAWGARDIPFAPQAWLDSPALQALQRRLEQAALFSTVCLVTGPNGVGKSAAVGRWLWKLDPQHFEPVALTQASLGGAGLLAAIAQKLGQSPCFRREGNLRRIETALEQLERRRLVLVLDEAQLYSFSALEEIRLLLGLNLPERPAFGLVLVGDDYLLDTLKVRHHRALYSRVAARVSLEPWSAEQCQDWLRHAWTLAGLPARALEAAAIELLVKAAAGLPRSLQILARAAWLQAAQAGQTVLAADHVQAAIDVVPCVPGREREGLPP